MFVVGLLLNLYLDLIIASQKNPKTTILRRLWAWLKHSKYCIQTTCYVFLGSLTWGSFGARFGHHFGTLFGGLLEESTLLWGVKASSLTLVCKTVFEA